ncbi:MAG: hypothetical protein HWD86_11225 [Kangiellaceae bacterium]|nr:hypothetical protein [Kangiellaceae bacterium]
MTKTPEQNLPFFARSPAATGKGAITQCFKNIDAFQLFREFTESSPEPSQFNPHVLSCDNCGSRQHLTKKYCECGHYLEGQLNNHYWHWKQTRKRQYEQRSRRQRILSVLTLLFGVLLASLFILPITVQWAFTLSATHFETVYSLVYVVCMGSLIGSSAFGRAAKKSIKAIGYLTREKFLYEEFEARLG